MKDFRSCYPNILIFYPTFIFTLVWSKNNFLLPPLTFKFERIVDWELWLGSFNLGNYIFAFFSSKDGIWVMKKMRTDNYNLSKERSGRFSNFIYISRLVQKLLFFPKLKISIFTNWMMFKVWEFDISLLASEVKIHLRWWGLLISLTVLSRYLKGAFQISICFSYT